jgi:hypothetical protein
MFINLCEFTECNEEHSEIVLINKYQYTYIHILYA